MKAWERVLPCRMCVARHPVLCMPVEITSLAGDAQCAPCGEGRLLECDYGCDCLLEQNLTVRVPIAFRARVRVGECAAVCVSNDWEGCASFGDCYARGVQPRNRL